MRRSIGATFSIETGGLNRFLLAALLVLSGQAFAGQAAPAANDPALEARMLHITAELRCLVCQNQTIADSHAELAVDLRQQVRELLQKGQTDQQIMDYMTARYGDFVLYRPPVKNTTLLLWYGPAAAAVLGMIALVVMLRRRSRMPAENFDPDELDEPPASPGSQLS
jgi:cytochrome c-type biogenesis protein CcmH